MRRIVTMLGIVAIVALAAGAVFAGQQVSIDNESSDPYWNYKGIASPGWYSPIATTGGALWINTGNGPVQYNLDADVNIQFKVDAPDPYGWTTFDPLLIGVQGGGMYDVTGWWPDDPGGFTCGSDPSIPGTSTITGPSNSYNMELYFWTGNYATYAAAQAAAAAHTPGVYVADSGVFNQSVPYVGLEPPPIPPSLADMPATILSQNPILLLLGDANGDGKVDINDLTIVLTNYGQTTGMGSWAKGDFNTDGKVDINDLTIVLTNYGSTGAAGLKAVPEPGALALMAAGLAGLLAYVCRRRR